jgi:hypothetical protein
MWMPSVSASMGQENKKLMKNHFVDHSPREKLFIRFPSILRCIPKYVPMKEFFCLFIIRRLNNNCKVM